MPFPERQLISRIRRFVAKAPANMRTGSDVIAGIGDDCAVLRVPAGHELLVTTDFSLEGVHFRREWHSAESIGHRCLLRGLSDIAAMGGQPMAAFLSLALPARTTQQWVDGFINGLLRLAKQVDVPLAGGDTTQSPEKIFADIVVVGSVPQGTTVLRSGAKAGDHVYVTGKLGAAAAETDRLYREGLEPGQTDTLPQPRIAIGRRLRERGIATAMIDISDGLSTDLSHICEESGVGAEIWAEAIPRAMFRNRSVELAFALHGGDAYELLFTAGRSKSVPASIAGVPVAHIGEVTRGKKMTLIEASGRRSALKPLGWEHFRHRTSKAITK